MCSVSCFKDNFPPISLTMEQFALNAQHSGAINHIHSFHFNSSVVDAFKEVRLAVTVIVVGWVAITTVRSIAGTKTKKGS